MAHQRAPILSDIPVLAIMSTNPENLSCAAPNSRLLIGIYGVSGSEKTFFVDRLKQGLQEEEQFIFSEGAEIGESSSRTGEEGDSQRHRDAVEKIVKEFIKSNKKVGFFVDQITIEDDSLRKIFYQHQILLLRLPYGVKSLTDASAVVPNFSASSGPNNEEKALALAHSYLDSGSDPSSLQTVLVVDADKTLAEEDTGKLFWNEIPVFSKDPLNSVFSSHLQYSYLAFKQASLLYTEAANVVDFHDVCLRAASKVKLHPEFNSLLSDISNQDHVSVIVVTCGLQRIWEAVLKNHELQSKNINVIGGGRFSDGPVVTPQVKAAIVSSIRSKYGVRVVAIGDSPVDLPMLQAADQAIVAVGDPATRSQSMEARLSEVINAGTLKTQQVLLPSHVPPRLDTERLPVTTLESLQFPRPALFDASGPRGLQFHHATSKAASKLLSTTMRDSSNSGPALREAHQLAGYYLAIEYVAELIGLEDVPISHVQGRPTTGSRLFCEPATLIVALMRGGEPMALGVSAAFPSAAFLHAKDAEDVKPFHLHGVASVVLVDSVVNTGKSISEFLAHVRKLDAGVRIVVVAGVVQAEAVDKTKEGSLIGKLEGEKGMALVALRVSENMYTGKGGTDTGNRLYNTTGWPDEKGDDGGKNRGREEEN